jgi:hypothetical protein
MRNTNEIAIYETEDGQVKVGVLFEEDNLWLTQKLLAELFECSVDNISLHLKNIFKEKELDQNSVVRNFRTTASECKKIQNETLRFRSNYCRWIPSKYYKRCTV